MTTQNTPDPNFNYYMDCLDQIIRTGRPPLDCDTTIYVDYLSLCQKRGYQGTIRLLRTFRVIIRAHHRQHTRAGGVSWGPPGGPMDFAEEKFEYECLLSEDDDLLEGDQSNESFRFTPDFRCVWLRGKTFTLSGREADVIQMLWECRQQGTPDLSQAHVLSKLGSESSRLRDLFEDRKAWYALIAKGKRKSMFRLNL